MHNFKQISHQIVYAEMFAFHFATDKDITIDYIALEVPNDFIVGYGLDYDGLGRNLENIYTIVSD